MATGFVQFDTRILDLAERENECDDLFVKLGMVTAKKPCAILH